MNALTLRLLTVASTVLVLAVGFVVSRHVHGPVFWIPGGLLLLGLATVFVKLDQNTTGRR